MRRLTMLMFLAACHADDFAVAIGPGNDGTITVQWEGEYEASLLVLQPDSATSEAFSLPGGCGLVHTNLDNFEGYAVAVLTDATRCVQATTDNTQPLALPVADCPLLDGLGYVGC